MSNVNSDFNFIRVRTGDNLFLFHFTVESMLVGVLRYQFCQLRPDDLLAVLAVYGAFLYSKKMSY